MADGTRSTAEIWARLLTEGFRGETIWEALRALDNRALVEEAAQPALSLTPEERERFGAQCALWAEIAGSPFSFGGTHPDWGEAAQAALKDAWVAVVGAGLAAADLVRLLARVGVGHLAVAALEGRTDHPSPEPETAWLVEETRAVSPGVEVVELARPDDLPQSIADVRPHLLVYCPDRFDEQVCRDLNQLCVHSGLPFLPRRGEALVVEVGPLVRPRQSACYACYERRRNGALLSWGRLPPPAASDGPQLRFPLALDWLALEAVKLITGLVEPLTQGRLLRISFLGGLPELHPVLKLPRCPVCGVTRTRPAHKLWEL